MTAILPTRVCLCVHNMGNSLPKAQGSMTHTVNITPNFIIKRRCQFCAIQSIF